MTQESEKVERFTPADRQQRISKTVRIPSAGDTIKIQAATDSNSGAKINDDPLSTILTINQIG
jgi:hypothetical protein